jgi:hypothetical protein
MWFALPAQAPRLSNSLVLGQHFGLRRLLKSYQVRSTTNRGRASLRFQVLKTESKGEDDKLSDGRDALPPGRCLKKQYTARSQANERASSTHHPITASGATSTGRLLKGFTCRTFICTCMATLSLERKRHYTSHSAPQLRPTWAETATILLLELSAPGLANCIELSYKLATAFY